MKSVSARFISDILAWYEECGRDLPWRHTHDPYKILVSEIMLQQTQVERVVPKYKEFLKKFPSSRKLAEAKTAEVIQAWRGLGYNRRALFLQRTAQKVQGEFGGRFPRQRAELLTLPGVGEYTARAILCFAFLRPVAVLDTNHRKFYQRFLFEKKSLSDAELLQKADELLSVISQKDPVRAYHWNQAIMDFMTAVTQRNTHPLVQKFIGVYPGPKAKKKVVKKSVPFKQTDRFIRGRIVDALRDGGSVSIAHLYNKMFPDFSQDRLEQVVAGLAKDGLIKRKKQVIVLV